MFMFNILFFSLMNSLLFTQFTHPLAMTLIIILQTLIVCLISGMITVSFWFSYILFLVFLGGMLVLFIYITSLASNEIFSISLSILSMLTLMSLLALSLSMIMDHYFQWMWNYDMMLSSNSIIMYKETDNLLTKLYNTPTKMITLLLMSYLLLTLIVIVKITNIFEGPLRQKN
uniref:NADH-ubiquinone oxidoreductase chain 6 n=1 Tax=Conanalus pieli TaxID=948347 RepID=A0A5C1ZZK9_9ORTH|nr:NADH dehydrogenase subunit 6 [Conanalus pieli]